MKKPQVQIINAIERTPEIIRVAPYVRVSSMLDDQIHSFHTQYNSYYDLVTARPDWQLVDVYADEGISGVNTDRRDAFNEMIEMCRARFFCCENQQCTERKVYKSRNRVKSAVILL